MTSGDDLAFADATECVRAIGAREVSSRELLELLVERIDRLDGPVNAVVTLDLERARARADEADRTTAAGGSWGPLHGLPMTIKDVWETAGIRTTSGAPALAEHVPDTNAIAVARLLDAGAIVFGKTNTPLYAGDVQTFNEVFGTTGNPCDPTRSAGGSSGGAAAAVAAGFTPLELGSDIGGSIRLPSHLCGTFGLKPSWAIVPSRGHIPGPPGSLLEVDVNSGGPMARSVRDLSLGLDVLAGPLPEDEVAWHLDLPAADVADVSDLRVGVVLDDAAHPVAAEVRDVLRSAFDQLSDAGALVEEIDLPVPLPDMYASWQRLVLPIIGADLPDDVRAELEAVAPAMTGDDTASRALRSMVADVRDRARADQARQLQRRRWAAAFETYDVVLCPVFQLVAHPHDLRPIAERTIEIGGVTSMYADLIAWCGGIGAMLLPVAAIPAGRTAGDGPGSGLPVGMQVVGPFLRDRAVLAAAEAITNVIGGFEVPPGF
ncbi:amidase family protein [Dermatobacter hominis]|uniref:amidase family protein n=1 Tax=Dermatobacter hominis TaxID=2884263 RepID=UPI001D120096|nr:amidase family protein [Dermatobacter hominis]UDY35850.1 hypothetical protein LH044_21345 [Dermatobacter hominis]